MRDDYDDFEYQSAADGSLIERLLERYECVAGRLSQSIASLVTFPLRLLGISRDDNFDYSESDADIVRPRSARPGFAWSPIRLLGRGKRSVINYIEIDENTVDQENAARRNLVVRLRFQAGRLFFQTVQIPFFASVDFAHGWLVSRNYRNLLYAIPSLLLTAIAAGVFGLSALSSPRGLATHYRKAAATARDNGNFAMADLCQQRLEQLDPSNRRRDEFAAAKELAKAGKMDEAYQRMRKLAPVDEMGYPEAHLWIARALNMKQVTPAPNEDVQGLMQAHLDRVLERYPKNELALSLLVDLHAAQGATEKAIATLKQVPSGDQEAQLVREIREAYLYVQAGDIARAHEMLKDSTATWERMFARGKSLTANSFLAWGNGQVLLGDREAALRVLQLGIEQHPEDEGLLSAYRDECDALRQTYLRSGAGEKHLDLLRRMLAYQPDDQQVLLMIADACAQRSISTEAQKLLQPKLGDGNLPTDVYERLAQAALARGDQAEARRRYTSLCKSDPRRPTALNNLAYLLAHQEPTSFERALTVIQQAIAIEESNIAYRGTRGLILMKLERWDEAIQDLELALSGNPKHEKLYHEALATAYKKIGNPELSARHRNRSLARAESTL